MAPLRQLVACGKALRQPVLSWVFCFAVAMTVFNHVPYEFYQPYLELLLTGAGGGYDVTPMVAGLLVAAVSMAGAWASGRSPAVRDRLGVPATLLAMMVLHGTVILAMSAWLNPMVLLLILLRSVPRAIAAPVIRAAIHPRISQEVRATFLSLLSLAGRLGFSLSLYAASRMIGAPERLDFSLIGQVLQAYAIGLGGVLAGLLLFSFLVNWSDGEWGSTGTEA